jgi:hypothetical protein
VDGIALTPCCVEVYVTRLLYRANASGAWAFFARPNAELDEIAFLKMVEGPFFDFRMMEEQISLIAGDESESLFAYNLLDLSLRHGCTPLKFFRKLRLS